ncbi:CarboxypepD_reg-like domain-containing protein [Lutibacter oricola]|uniref:CarboxypepD_reg-like domain-containing protein n=1 Tax=Lutibacter oricola TaxID=762486 RepID=A0A1H2ZG09_9FLAO|nr:carboxypeptidase-like regulatory domain-containing protein [Lutibacter oricola]SDX16306.1 CarboxypepD_reg-like domain-containing protein [Lutibacter oricola]
MSIFSNKKMFFFKNIIFIFLVSFSLSAQVKNVVVSGLITDGTDFPLPYVAVGIVGKNIGTTTTEDGQFLFNVSKSELQDSLYVSYLGFHSHKVKIEDYLALEEKKIILKEDVVALDDVEILAPITYITNALKRLKENTLYQPHLTEFLFRRAATEEGKSKFFVENYIKVKDRGPASFPGQIQVVEARKSADYRSWKREQWRHSILSMYDVNPLRPQESMHKRNLKKFNWKKVDDTSYEGEDVVILEGRNPKVNWERIKLYIGIDTYKVYKIERGRAVFIYKKHKSGKLHLSYFRNHWSFPKDKIPKHLLGTTAESLNYRLEAFVYNVETEDKKKMRVREYGKEKDMGTLDLPYNPDFWKNLNLPPDTKFYKRIKSELEGLFGVSLELQYELSNK